ncbi:MAG: cytochrome ubiquinol oxidase subunit I [Candidatus Thiodiazotropha sp. (ex Lucina aurantia)]|nr:cytochrome ubiquinol oxidase subunit I [Candidatus Thiodiazotropha sp. (ex Lucina pensylvanica)]MBT3023014.1 cytochrome ubiquinol oxidase subunit I [Candidatus Thiodiazotropha taylori]MBT3038680.1 cytochrome ubiquinol oxidase subunit I [Candidatus Thiodiazotropha sp. (ex Codakia orbicularis)]MBV2102656.1 cytochrome ubiquinol oxidase subunit I [Candidatus Thiodiazotropha sp. (ex Lucina aurantia)]MCG7863740.1 cytochrome ubiquinol oxidase subunit I [Candidatus Thiodiazotropha endolucinida]
MHDQTHSHRLGRLMASRNLGLIWLLVVVGLLLSSGTTLAADDADRLNRIAPIGMVQVAGEPPVSRSDSTATDVEAEEQIVAPRLSRSDYPDIGVSSRAIVWILAQLHLFFGALVLAVPLFVLIIELLGVYTGDERYDNMAYEFMKISLTGFSITAIFGGSLALALFLLYPDFMSYMMHVFGAQVLVYAILFFLESFFLYTYYYGWNAFRYGNRKWVHLSLGLMLNASGLTIMVVANSWATFMMAPSGVNEVGAVVGNIWEIMKGPLWNPINLHRFIANIAFGGAVVGAYAAFKFLSTNDPERRAHYDWMGYTSNFIAILAFLPLPFAGYWLMAEIYAYSQQMGITAMGGILAWLFIVQAVLIGTILLAGNFYLWAGMSRTEGSGRYKGLIKFIAVVLVVCFLIWVTPHTLILSASEISLLGGSHHHILGPLGIMPAKNIAVNLMLVVTFLSFQLYRRSDKVATVGWAPMGNALMVSIYVVAFINIIFLGVYYGYFTNTVYKVGSSVAQVATTLVVIVAGIVIDTLMFKNAKTLPSHWGRIPDRAQYALFALPIAFTWLMGLMGYVRSSVKTHWHVYTVMKDNSPDNFIPTIAYAGNMITVVTILFLLCVLFMFWVANLSTTKQAKPTPAVAGGVA